MKVRKAKGLNVAGGRRIGRILAFGRGPAAALNGRIGCTGVANAGDEEGIGFILVVGVAGGLKIEAVFDFGIGFGRLIFPSQVLKFPLILVVNRPQLFIS